MLFPIFLQLTGRVCLVVGEGPEADRRAALLRRCGGEVRRAVDFDDELLTDVVLLMVAETPPAVAEAAARTAMSRGVLVNVIDRPDFCSFALPAIVERGPLVVAISSSGTAPALARLLRVVLDRALPKRIGDLATLAGRFRPLVSLRLRDPHARRCFWRGIFQSRVAVLTLLGRPASRVFLRALGEASRKPWNAHASWRSHR